MASTPSPGGSAETLPSSPSSTGAQNAKAKRYDRQLRLWGDHGQLALEKAKVCLIGATATATEILKSLVLPGVGRFTIVDGKKVTGEDIGNNFFLGHESINQSRGSVATRLLLELNPEVRGDCVDESAEQVLNNRPDFFTNFHLVIATEIGEKTLATLSSLLWTSNIPLMIVRTYGLLGYIRLQIGEHSIIESHPDNVFEDLRLDQPFPQLKEFMDSQDFQAMNKNEYLHTPYVVILYKYLEDWKKNHDGKLPKDYASKRQLKDLINKGMRNGRDDLENDELENFQEALRAVNTALQPSKVPDSLKKILEDPKCTSPVTAALDDFWIMARSLKDFVDHYGALPLRGSIPDMFSDSDRYINLSNIYRAKAMQDAEVVYRSVQSYLESVGKSPESIAETTVRKFCKEAANLRLLRDSASIADEMNGKLMKSDLVSTLEQNPDSEIAYYLILRGVERFQTDFNVLPGGDDDQVEPDIGRLKSCVAKVLSDCYPGVIPSVIKDDYVHEVCRYGAAEPHALAAFIGGCAAHEAIKLLTSQYVPIDNLFLFNAMTMNTQSLKIA